MKRAKSEEGKESVAVSGGPAHGRSIRQSGCFSPRGLRALFRETNVGLVLREEGQVDRQLLIGQCGRHAPPIGERL